MAKYETSITGHFHTIVTALHGDIMGSAASMELVDRSDFTLGGAQVAVRVYDKYYMRNSSRASLTLVAAGEGNTVKIVAVGAGGGQGAVFNFSWGAEEDLVEVVKESVGRLR